MFRVPLRVRFRAFGLGCYALGFPACSGLGLKGSVFTDP